MKRKYTYKKFYIIAELIEFINGTSGLLEVLSINQDKHDIGDGSWVLTYSWNSFELKIDDNGSERALNAVKAQYPFQRVERINYNNLGLNQTSTYLVSQ